ncbi:25862_t:CDS:2, partial [Gigaspora margarita]
IWTDDQLCLLITERRNRNADYHDIPGSSRVSFWNDIANIINKSFSTNYTGYQCKGKFQNLVRDHTLMCQYMAGNRAGRRTRTGVRYFEKFRSRFWERPVAASPLLPKGIVQHLLTADAKETLLQNNASQNDSDISMPDIGGSQPPFCMENINEED